MYVREFTATSISEDELARQMQLLRPCTRCSKYKPDSGFHNSKTGQFSYCAECRREYDRIYYAMRGREARRERQRQREATGRVWGASINWVFRAPTAAASFQSGSCSGITSPDMKRSML